MTDFKVGDRVNLRQGTKSYMGHPLPSCDEYTLFSKHEYPGIWNVGREALCEGPSWMVADVSMVLLPQPISNAELLGRLEAATKVIGELRGDIERANTLVAALERLLAAERERNRAVANLRAQVDNLDEAKTAYYKAREDFDTNGGESK